MLQALTQFSPCLPCGVPPPTYGAPALCSPGPRSLWGGGAPGHHRQRHPVPPLQHTVPLPSAPQVCRECFYAAFEDEVHRVITASGMFRAGERVAVGASGGKDSTVLAHILTTLNARHR